MAGPNLAVDTKVQAAIRASVPVLSLKGLLTDEMSESIIQFNAVPTSTTSNVALFQDTGAAWQACLGTWWPVGP